jgi:hypothetical protein
MHIDPAQVPADLKEPAMQPGYPPARVPGAVTTQPDARALLAAVADALNAAERAGLIIASLDHGVVKTRAGYVVPFGSAELGCRWVARRRVPHDPEGAEG